MSEVDEFRAIQAHQDAERRAMAGQLVLTELGSSGPRATEDVAAVPLYAGEMHALLKVLAWWPTGAGEPLTDVVRALHDDLRDRWEQAAGHSPDVKATDRDPGMAAAADRFAAARAFAGAQGHE